jgi:hypothetical protein
MIGVAAAAPVTVGSVSFDSDDAAETVLWAQGGVFSGLPQNLREACVDPTNPASTVGANGIECRANEIAGWDPNNLEDDAIELDENNTQTQDPDVLAAFFHDPLVNGAGDDLIIFETLNQDDSPAITIVLNGVQITGTKLDVVTIDGDIFTIWGFDFSDSPLSLAAGAVIGQPIFIQTFRDAQNTPVGSSDIAAIIGLHFQDVVVPLPAAAPLFFAGIAGLGFAAGRRKRRI